VTGENKLNLRQICDKTARFPQCCLLHVEPEHPAKWSDAFSQEQSVMTVSGRRIDNRIAGLDRLVHQKVGDFSGAYHGSEMLANVTVDG